MRILNSTLAEEPLEIRLIWQDANGRAMKKNIAVTMRTPGDDFELAAGFLHGEGIVHNQGDIVDVAFDSGEKKRFALSIAPLKVM